MKTKAAILDEMQKRRGQLSRYSMSYQEYFDACIDIMFEMAAEVLSTVATHDRNGGGEDDTDHKADG
jgi:hypothetical protein